MNSCEPYQAQLLAYLYDLLEPEDRQALQGHLDQCAACQAALTRAKGQQKLLAAAAKAEFPAVRFQPPAVEEQPTIRLARFGGGAWGTWALAASILLLLGVSVAGGWWTVRYLQQQQQAEMALATYEASRSVAGQLAADRQEKLARTEREFKLAEHNLQELDRTQPQKWAALAQQVRDRQLDVLVTGPEALEPGACNEFQVRTQNLNGNLVVAQLAAKVRNEKNELVYELPERTCNGVYRLALPRDLPLKPNSKLSLEIVAQREGGAKSKIREDLSLAAPVYLTHLTTDKPMYQPGETVYFRSLTLERFSLKPADVDFHLIYKVTGPNGEELFSRDGATQLLDENSKAPVLGPDKKPIKGIGAGEYVILPGATGGEYTLTVREASNRFLEQQRKFIVNRYEKPRLNKELDFTRKSYGPGEEVVAACKVARAEGGAVVAGQPVTVSVFIDGKPYGRNGTQGANPWMLRTDDKGHVAVQFKLPAVIERGQASLSVVFTDNNIPETLVRPIPVVVKKLDVEFFPEGGDLVTGLPNRVYFQARTLLGKPAELKGRVVDQAGKVVVKDVHTLHDDTQPGANQGMGAFTFTPQAGSKYELKIDAPAGIEGKYALSMARDDWVILTIPDSVSEPRQPIRVVVQSTKERTLLVGAYCRGRLMDHKTVTVQKGEGTPVELKPVQEAGGVYRVTVFEEQAAPGDRAQLVPVAERLVYRKPAEQLILNVKPNLKQYIPGERVTCSVSALDEREQPAPAVMMLAVVDKSVVTMADEKTYRTMPTHYYLTTEVRRPEDLEHADFLLSSHARAATALDLLLGTQGWRRFAEQNPQAFPQKFKDDTDRKDAQRLLVMNGQSALRVVDLQQHEAERLRVDYATQRQALSEQFARASQAWTAAQDPTEFRQQVEAQRQHTDQARAAYLAAVANVNAHRNLATRVTAVALPVAAIFLVVLAGFALLIAVRRSLPRAVPQYATALVCLLVLVGLVLFVPWEQANNAARMIQMENQWQQQEAADALRYKELVQAEQPRPETATKSLPRPEAPPPPAGMARRQVLEQHDAPAAAPMRGGPAAFRPGGMAGQQAKELPPAGLNVMAKDKQGAAKDDLKAAKPAEQWGQLRDRNLNYQFGMDKKDREKAEALQHLQPRFKDMKREAAFAPLFEKERVPAEQQLERKALRAPVADDGKKKAGAKMAGLEMGDVAQGRRAFGGAKPAGGFGGINGQPGLDLGMPMGEARMGFAAMPAMVPPPPPPAPLMVREYAHQRSPGQPTEQRIDFAETLYWHPAMVLPNGKGEFSFSLCDSVTTFQVTGFGHTLDGRIGAVSTGIESRLPFNLEPKLPIEVTASDTIDVPVAVTNNTNEARQVSLVVSTTGLNSFDPPDKVFACTSDARTRRVYRFQPNLVEGQARLTFAGKSDPFTDSVTRALTVVPDGFPVVGSHSDMLEKVARNDVVLPENWIKGTLKCQVQVYPSTLADLQKGLEALLREPGGCFEQTSSNNYPNVLILDYLKESDQAKPEVERRARDMLARGYRQLVSFECLEQARNARRGYEWFGGAAPPHEALTAYGLLEFRDMARVFEVDPKMVERTRQYLLTRKDGKGGFERNPRALDTFGRAPDNITNAYIVWALTESGNDDVEKELTAQATQARTSKDPYFLALVANSLLNRGRADEGMALLKTVAGAQKEDGHLDAAQTSITGSGGRDLQIETTALAVLGWLKANRPTEFNVPLQKAVKWIGQQRGGYGGFGSTQSTILALKAIIAFARANKKTPEAGELRLYAGDQAVAHLSFPAGVQDALTLDLPQPEKYLKAGKTELRVEITGKNVFPYTLAWSYQTVKPVSAEKCPVRLTTTLDRADATESETVHLTVKVENTADKGQGMAVAVVGLPAGLTLPEDMKQLKDYARLRNGGTEKGLIGAWEVRGREVVLYWRDLAPKQQIEVPLDLICRVPGKYRGPASRAYLYYNADQKHWVDPLAMSIKPKAE
jgi:hypothetical protein